MNNKKVMICEPIKNSGLILKDPSPENYHSRLFGAVGQEVGGILSPVEPPVIFENGKGWEKAWEDYDIQEVQFNNNFDSYSCVIFTIAKATCLYLFKVYGVKCTISEMYNAFFAGVVPNQGTTIEAGMESLRKHGWVEDKDYPFTAETTATQFFARPPKTICIKAEGKITEWDLHWNVIPKTLDAIIKAYKCTPVVLTGFAWASYYGTVVYSDNGNQANHAFLGLELADNGNNLISDTYPKDFQYKEDSQINAGDLIKELNKTFNYGSAHTVWLTTKTTEKKTLFLILKSMLNNIWAWFETTGSPKGLRAYYVPTDSMGSPKGKQVIDLQNPTLAIKTLYVALFEAGAFKKTSWPEISKIDDKNFI